MENYKAKKRKVIVPNFSEHPALARDFLESERRIRLKLRKKNNGTVRNFVSVR